MATKPKTAAGRYTVDDISAITRGRGAIPMGVDLGNSLFASLGISNGWDMAEQGDTGVKVPGGLSADAYKKLSGYTYDWSPVGKRSENGWLTAYNPDGTQAARVFQEYSGEKKNVLDAAALAAAGFGGLGLATGLGPLGGLQGAVFGEAGGGLVGPPVEAAGGLMGPPVEAAGLGALDAASLSYAPVGAESSFGLMNAGAAAPAGAGGIPYLSVPTSAMEASIAASPALTPAAMNAAVASTIPANIAGLGAAGLAAADAAPAVFNAAKDSQAANAAMQAAGTPTGAAIAPKGVNLVNAGGVASASGGGWGVLDPIAGALDSAKGAVAGVVGDKGADLLWNLGKGAIGTALAGGAANALAPKVDTSGLEANAAAARDIANRQMTLAERQYADQKALLDQYSPMIQDLIKGQLTDQGISRDRATSQWNDYTTTWRPLEQQLASSAASWGSPARYRQEADRAGVDAATQFDRAKQSQIRQLQMSGASPEKIAALTAAGDILAAKGTAGARSQAYRDAEMKGLNVLQGAASFGRNMPSTGIQVAGLAGQQGQQGLAGVQGLSNMTSTPAALASQLMGQSLNANNTATQSLLQAQNLGLQAANNRNAIFGDILGAGLGAVGMSGGLEKFFSSETMKDVGAKVDGKDAEVMVSKSPARKWSYKKGMGDGNTKPRFGPTAEDLRDATDGVVSDGRTVDGIGMLGLHHAAIGSLSKRLDKIERKTARVEG